MTSPPESAGPSFTESGTVSQTAEVSTVAEPKAFINCREIEDWCNECRKYRPPVISATNAFSGSLGLFVGFLTALASTQRSSNATWWGIFLAGTLAAAAGMLGTLVYLAFSHLPWLRTKFGMAAKDTALQPLAERMDRANAKGIPATVHQRVQAGPFSVTQATYGASGGTADVTERLNALVANGRIDFVADNATLGGDPAPNEGKLLTVQWTVGGQPFSSSFAEGTHIVLPD